MKDSSKQDVTLEYIQRDEKSFIVITHRPGQESVQTILEIVPPQHVKPREKEKKA